MQYFNNEELEADRYDKYLQKYSEASLKTGVRYHLSSRNVQCCPPDSSSRSAEQPWPIKLWPELHLQRGSYHGDVAHRSRHQRRYRLPRFHPFLLLTSCSFAFLQVRTPSVTWSWSTASCSSSRFLSTSWYDHVGLGPRARHQPSLLDLGHGVQRAEAVVHRYGGHVQPLESQH